MRTNKDGNTTPHLRLPPRGPQGRESTPLADNDLLCHLQGPKADASGTAQSKPAKGPVAGGGASQALPPQHPSRGKHQRQPSALDLVHASSSSSTLLQVAASGAVGEGLGLTDKQGGGAKLEGGLSSEP